MEIAKSHTPSYIWIDSLPPPSLALSISLFLFGNPDPWITSERKSGRGPLLQRRGVLDASDRADPVATSPQQGIPDCERRRARVRTYVHVHAHMCIKGSSPKAWRGMTIVEGPRDRARRETQLELNWSVLGRAFEWERRRREGGKEDGERAEFSWGFGGRKPGKLKIVPGRRRRKV